MAQQKRRIKTEINGKEYTIVSEKSSAHIKLVAETINKQLGELNKLSPALSTEDQAILMAVNAISDQIESHEKMLEMEEAFQSSLKD